MTPSRRTVAPQPPHFAVVRLQSFRRRHNFQLPAPSYGGAVQADGITSANTVGYTSQEVKAGQFYMVGVQFADVKATDTVDLNTLLSTTCAPGEIGDGEAPHPPTHTLPTHTLPIMSRSFAILSAWRTGS